MLSAEDAKQYATLNVLKTTYSNPNTIDNWNPYEDIKDAGIIKSIVAINEFTLDKQAQLPGMTKGKERIIIVDLSGRMLMESNVHSMNQDFHIEIDGLCNGTYILYYTLNKNSFARYFVKTYGITKISCHVSSK